MMPTSVWDHEVSDVLARARTPSTKRVNVGDHVVDVASPFPSPADWRDQPIYQIMIDRFCNPASPPNHQWDEPQSAFQGGTFEGIRQHLDYLQQLGIGAIWLSPVQKNGQHDPNTHHGYGIQDFLAIEPRFASAPDRAESELQALIDEAHARGIYVIFDIVLNHAGDVFAYNGHGSLAPWSPEPYRIQWRDEHGQARADWSSPPHNPERDATIWPDELRRNEVFRRQGIGSESGGDFYSLKEFVTGFAETTEQDGYHFPVRSALIRACEYLIATFDVDGFRIDTIKYIEPEFAQVFGSAIREFALSVGKKNFFTFGEVYDDEEEIARFVGRNAMEPGDTIGIDAALDFPLFHTLPGVTKGFLPPTAIAGMFNHRKEIQRTIVSSHGDASRFFVTFLDNHDQHARFHYRDPADPGRYDAQTTLGLGCLFALQGIPCLYYGTEQGLSGAGTSPEAVREALWGKPDGFGPHAFYATIQQLASVRAGEPALRYGRQYFRPISGDGMHFAASAFSNGVVAFSRILQDQEVLIVANTNPQTGWSGDVLVDFSLNSSGSRCDVLFSNVAGDSTLPPGAIVERMAGSVEIRDLGGSVSTGPARTVPVQLQAMEIQMLRCASRTTRER